VHLAQALKSTVQSLRLERQGARIVVLHAVQSQPPFYFNPPLGKRYSALLQGKSRARMSSYLRAMEQQQRRVNLVCLGERTHLHVHLVDIEL